MPFVVVALCLALSGCSVDGQATAGAGDLAEKSVSPRAFPGGTASRVPAPAVPAALADLTGRPMHGSVAPPECTPVAVSSDGAVVLVGPSPTIPTATFTSAVAHAGDTVDDVTELAGRCPHTTSGSAPTAESAVTTEVVPAPGRDAVQTGAIRRTISTGGPGAAPMITSTTTLMAQREDVRVLVDYRQQGGEAMSPEAGAQLDALFDAAVDAAFG